MSSAWPMHPISQLGSVTTGSTPSTSDETLYGGDIPFVTPAELDEMTPVVTATRTLSALGASRARVLPANTVMVCCIGSLGKVGIAGRPLATNQQINSIEFDATRVWPRYGFYACRRLKPRLEVMAPATTVPIVSKSKFEVLEIPVPPLPEQRRIAEILDKADLLRAKRRAALAQLDTLTQSIFLDMFGDPLTNPKRFTIKTLAEFYVNEAEGTRCGPFGSALKKSELVSDGIPVWNMDNIDPSGRMVLPFRMWISESKYRQLEAYAVADGDVIVSRAGTVGKMCVVRTDGVRSIISTNLIRLRFGPRLLPLYFVSLMTYCKGRVGRLRTGEDGAFTHMNTGILDTLKFPHPPLDLQRQFATIVESMEKQKSRHGAQLAELELLFTSLQHRAFRGERQA